MNKKEKEIENIIENIIQTLKKEYKIVVLDKKRREILFTDIYEGLINYQTKDIDVYLYPINALRTNLVEIIPKNEPSINLYDVIDDIKDIIIRSRLYKYNINNKKEKKDVK